MAEQKPFPIVLFGATGVGKLCFWFRSHYGRYDEDRCRAIIPGLGSYTAKSSDNNDVQFQIWCTPTGLFRPYPAQLFRRKYAFLLCFDLSKKDSLEWVDNLMNHNQDIKMYPDTVRVLLGFKADLQMAERQVSAEDARVVAEAHSMTYFECSSKTGVGIAQIYDYLADRCLLLHEERLEEMMRTVKLNPSPLERQGSCQC